MPAGLRQRLLLQHTFKPHWRTALKQHAVQPSPDPVGPWEGVWKSIAKDRGGMVEAVVRPTDNPEVFQFYSRARDPAKAHGSATHTKWKMVLKGNRVVLTRKRNWIQGGDFYSRGTVERGKFVVGYEDCWDNGTLEMQRPSKDTMLPYSLDSVSGIFSTGYGQFSPKDGAP